MALCEEHADDGIIEETVQSLLTQFPTKELRIRSALADFEGHAGSAALQLQHEADNMDAPGRYVVVVQSYVKAGIDTSTAKIGDVLPERVVEIAEVVENEATRRIRGRLVEPAGWISLMNTETGQRWAERIDDEPGEYRIIVPVHLKVSKDLDSMRVADIPKNAIVNVVEVQVLTEDKRVRGRIDCPCDGWISLQCIEDGLCWARRIPKPVVKRYRVDDKFISSQRPGLNYRLSPHLDDKDQGDNNLCLYGSVVTGVRLHDWLKVDMEECADRYLPFNVQGMRVLFEVDESGDAVSSAQAPASEPSPEPRALATAAENVEAMLTRMPSTWLPGEACLEELDDADVDRELELEAALEGFPEPNPDVIFGTDPRSPPESVTGIGVIAFCFPGYQERWDELCGAPFLGHHWNLGPGGIAVASKTLPEAPRHFCNASAAFHALQFWDQAERFEGLTGEEALVLKKELSQCRDPTYAGHESAWKANLAVLHAKFRPGSPNAAALLRTKDSFLLEHVTEAFDDVWSNNHIGDGKNWNGLQLMLVRDELSGRSADVMSWTQFISGPCHVDLDTGDFRGSSASDMWSDAVLGATDALQLVLGETIQRRSLVFTHLPSTTEEDEAVAEDKHGDGRGEPPPEAPPSTGNDLGASPREQREDPKGTLTNVLDQDTQPPLSEAFKQRHSVVGMAPPAPVEVDPSELPVHPRRRAFGRTLSDSFRVLAASGTPVPPRGDKVSVPLRAITRPSMKTRTLAEAFAARTHRPGSGD